MPNHVMNKVIFDGPDKKIKEILEAIQYDPDPKDEENTGIGSIDFNKIIPMPPELEIEAGWATSVSIRVYLTAVNPLTLDYGVPKMDAGEFKKLLDILDSSRLISSFKREFSDEEMHDYLKDGTDYMGSGKQAMENITKYGAPTWYEWRIINWGTKWNSYETHKWEDKTLFFETAWSPPIPVLDQLAKRYSDVVITLEWADYDIGQNTGKIVYIHGTPVVDWEPETRNEAIEFACSVWGDGPEDWGYYLNDEGKYIYDESHVPDEESKGEETK